MQLCLISHIGPLARVCRAVTMLLLVVACAGAAPVDSDEDFFDFDASPPHPRPLRVFMAAPQAPAGDAPVVIVLHGSLRNARDYRDAWRDHARRRGFLLIVPEFDRARFDDASYQLGNLFDAAGHTRPREQRTFALLERLFDEVKRRFGNNSPGYYLYGHSAGGQLVHRMVLFAPESRIIRAVAANAGWYCLPTFSGFRYPYGLHGAPDAPDLLPAAFSRELIILNGASDISRTFPRIRATDQAEAQGWTRFERAETFMAIARREAQRRSAVLKWRHVIVPGAGHSDVQVSAAAVEALLGPESVPQTSATPAQR